MTASPRPWYLEPFCGSNQHYVNDADGLRVADTPIHEDAELIVRVVNAHDALVAALEAAVTQMGRLKASLYGASRTTDDEFDDVLYQGQHALENVKGADRD